MGRQSVPVYQRTGNFHKYTRARTHGYVLEKCWYAGTLVHFPASRIGTSFRGSFAGLSRVYRGSIAGLPQVVPPSLVRRRWGFKEGAVSRPHQYKTQGKACLMCTRPVEAKKDTTSANNPSFSLQGRSPQQGNNARRTSPNGAT